MSQQITFEYFHGLEADQYTFYRIPKMLFTNECFKSLSCEAKVLYGLMLDRMGLSIKNRWIDEEDRVYIIFTVEDIAELMNCGTQKAVKLMKELDSKEGIGLIEKKRLGLGKPNVIYVKNFQIAKGEAVECEEKWSGNMEELQNGENHNSGMVEITNQKLEESQFKNNENHNLENMKIILQEVPESQFKNDENHNSGNMKITIQEVPESQFKNGENHNSGSMKIILQEVSKSQSNNTDINYTDMNDTDSIYPIREYPEEDKIDQIESIRNTIKNQIGYLILCQDNPYDKATVDELVELIVEILVQPDTGQIRMGTMELPVSYVKERFRRLERSHIQYVMWCMQKNTSRIGNIKAYLMTALYNAPTTIGNYYKSAVNADLAGERV